MTLKLTQNYGRSFMVSQVILESKEKISFQKTIALKIIELLVCESAPRGLPVLD